MYRGRRIAVVMPAYDVADRVGAAMRGVPAFVDRLIVVDDGSRDGTALVVQAERRDKGTVTLLCHPRNRGVGAAIRTGYAEALRQGAEVVAVMAGDGQMDGADLPALLDPVASGRADYAKGNRFLFPEVWRVMPRGRLIGNILLSLATKITSGYWHVFDSQSGYTAISADALRAIDGRVFQRYGYPNDLLARLAAVRARVVDVPVRAVYDGQRSGIRLWTVLNPILLVLLRSMARRLWQQRLRPLLQGDATRIELPSHADRAADHLLPAPRR